MPTTKEQEAYELAKRFVAATGWKFKERAAATPEWFAESARFSEACKQWAVEQEKK